MFWTKEPLPELRPMSLQSKLIVPPPCIVNVLLAKPQLPDSCVMLNVLPVGTDQVIDAKTFKTVNDSKVAVHGTLKATSETIWFSAVTVNVLLLMPSVPG